MDTVTLETFEDAVRHPEKYGPAAEMSLVHLVKIKTGKSLKEVMRSYGYSPHSLYYWRKEDRPFPPQMEKGLVKTLRDGKPVDQTARPPKFRTPAAALAPQELTQVLTIVTDDMDVMGAIRALAEHFRGAGKSLLVTHVRER